MLPETIKQDLVSKEFEYNYPVMYNDRLIQEQRNPAPVPTRNVNYPEINRVQLQPSVQFKTDTYQQNVITHINNRSDSYILNNPIGVRIAQPNAQVQIKSINPPTITTINNGLNYPQKIQAYQNSYVASPPPKAINNIRSQVYSIPQGTHIKMNLQTQPQFSVASLPVRNDIIESNHVKRKPNLIENNQNYRHQNHHFNENNKRKVQEREMSSEKSEEYFRA